MLVTWSVSQSVRQSESHSVNKEGFNFTANYISIILILI